MLDAGATRTERVVMTEAAKTPSGTRAGTVTVLMTIYNGEAYVRRSLDSVFAQTLQPDEVLVVDDGSTDGTGTLVAGEYGRRVRLIRQGNGGLANARNRGLREATGDYVALLDVDDWWAPTKLQRQAALLDARPEVMATYTSLITVAEQSGVEEIVTAVSAETLWPRIRWENPALAPSSMMMRRTALEEAGNFTEGMRSCEDWDCWFRLLRRGRMAEITEPLTYYQVSTTGLSGDAERMFRSFESILDRRLLDGLEGAERGIWRRRIVSFQAFKACLTARGAGDKARERSYMRRSLRAWPSPFWAPERFKYFVITLLRS